MVSPRWFGIPNYFAATEYNGIPKHCQERSVKISLYIEPERLSNFWNPGQITVSHFA